MSLDAGTRLGSYEVVRPIGAGAMGEVYRAKDLKLGREVALKVLLKESASDPDRLRRFEQEARAASALNHPNIVHIYDIGQEDDTHYIVMELVEGSNLRQLLVDAPFDNERLLDLSRQIVAGLANAHRAGIVHRDIKPENIMVTVDGFVKILDFGLAKLLVIPFETHSEMATMARFGTRHGMLIVDRVKELLKKRGGEDADALVEEVDGIVDRITALATKHRDLAEQTSPEEREELARTVEEVERKLIAATTADERRLLQRQFDVLRQRQQSIGKALVVIERLAVRRDVAEHQIKQLRLDLSRADASSARVPELTSRLQDIRHEVDATEKVDVAIAEELLS